MSILPCYPKSCGTMLSTLFFLCAIYSVQYWPTVIYKNVRVITPDMPQGNKGIESCWILKYEFYGGS